MVARPDSLFLSTFAYSEFMFHLVQHTTGLSSKTFGGYLHTTDFRRIRGTSWQYNRSPFSGKVAPQQESYPTVAADQLRSYTEPPREVKMLVRDWIGDSLYNRSYGYFSRHATIYSSGDELRIIDVVQKRSAAQFQDPVLRRSLAIAKCLASEYLLKYLPYEDLVIHEIDTYERTQYHIIEASSKLVEIQRAKLLPRHPLVTLNYKSAFDWDRNRFPLDNFAHDQIIRSYSNLQPYEALVTVSKDYDLDTIYQPVADPLIQHLLNLRHRLGQGPLYFRLLENRTMRNLYNATPQTPPNPPNLLPPPPSPPQRPLLPPRHSPRHHNTHLTVVQTRVQGRTVTTESYLVQPGWFDIFFPTDFEGLREMYEMILRSPLGSVEAPLQARSNYWAPSRLGGDFFFPRSGSLGSSSRGGGAEKCGRRQPVLGTVSATGLGIGVGERKSGVWSHKEFVEMYEDVDKTVCRNGENPMVDFYNNVKVLF
ncbi:hypothetical protein DL96DRAFT_1810947 [Flagelloscypha sp. PMI_526]|nr:hypothetical protein DL96DRAFT_1810947 [Flagelloscypha sp. PMI_526]